MAKNNGFDRCVGDSDGLGKRELALHPSSVKLFLCQAYRESQLANTDLNARPLTGNGSNFARGSVGCWDQQSYGGQILFSRNTHESRINTGRLHTECWRREACSDLGALISGMASPQLEGLVLCIRHFGSATCAHCPDMVPPSL